MRYVNNFELSSILAQPGFCSSNRLGVMAMAHCHWLYEEMNVMSKWQELAFPILVKTMETPLYLHNLS